MDIKADRLFCPLCIGNWFRMNKTSEKTVDVVDAEVIKKPNSLQSGDGKPQVFQRRKMAGLQ
jgi:hypothetical protein